jgi:hypothetical protein
MFQALLHPGLLSLFFLNIQMPHPAEQHSEKAAKQDKFRLYPMQSCITLTAQAACQQKYGQHLYLFRHDVLQEFWAMHQCICRVLHDFGWKGHQRFLVVATETGFVTAISHLSGH